jgi:hypothetical protein
MINNIGGYMEITKEQIVEWKKEHGAIFKISPIKGIDIIYRLITRDDYMEILASQMAGEISDPEFETVSRCIINDIDPTLLVDRGGIVTVVYEEIMKNSGFTLVESEEL